MSFRHMFAWSNTWDSWRERLVGLLLLAVGTLLLYLTVRHLGPWLAAILWSIYGLALAVSSRQGWIRLFGPVLFYDMVRTARRSRYSLIRILYGGFLFVTLCYLVMILALTPRMGGQPLRPRDTAMVAEWFFAFYMIVQVVIVVVLTPAYVAGAIAEEKDRKTLEFLMATDLDNREVVFSKLLSRLANMTLLLLTGLPILSILQLMGGVDPELMLAGFAGVGLTMLGIASISILFSTLMKKPRDAISVTYLFLLAYGSVATVPLIIPGTWVMMPIWFGENPPTLRDAIQVLNAGNPIAAIRDVIVAIEGGNRGARTNLAAELPGILTRYTWFHLALSAFCIAWSILRVRAIALKQTPAGTTMTMRWWEHLRPRVGGFPMLWKEFFIEGRTKVNWLVWIAALVIVVLTLGSGFWIVGDNFFHERGFGRQFREAMNIWFRVAGTAVGCLSILMLGVRAATCITSERERDTFDSLITTPMSGDGMLLAKVVGNLTSVRPAWFWFAAILLLALVTGGLNPLAVPLILAAWFVYAVFVTLLGTMFSVFCKSSIWSALFTMIATLFLGGGHWLITSCFCMPLFGLMMMQFNGNNRSLEKIGEYWVKFQGGMTPPAVFGICSFGWEERMMRDQWFWEFMGFSVLGLFLWTFLSGIIWFGLLAPKFRHIARRIELLTSALKIKVHRG
jgi:ABC-type transport system involved in multi-copper enzyme maturation permease subunit